MKIIKINTELNLKSGIQIPSGAVVVLNEILLRPSHRSVDNNNVSLFPIECSTLVYASQNALLTGKTNISDVADFDTVFRQLSINVGDYEQFGAEGIFVEAVGNALGDLYGAELIEVIDAV